MKFFKHYSKSLVMAFVAAAITSTFFINHAIAEENEELTVAFPDKWMIRVGAYIVDGSNTKFSVALSLIHI